MTDAPVMTHESMAAVGPGRLVLVVGPSGAGKDTLLGLAKQACASDPDIVFARRIITRPASLSEDNDEATPDAFRDAVERGDYALHWEAHGHCYALSRAIDDDLRAGRTVIANVSRTMISGARRAYAVVTVVAVTAPAQVIAERLAMRGRMSDGPIADRLGRAVDDASAVPDIVIDNIGCPEQHAQELAAIIQGQKS